MKLRNIQPEHEIQIGLMIEGNVEAIVKGAASAEPILSLSAILYGTKYRLRDPAFLAALRDPACGGETVAHGVLLGAFAQAALSVLQVQQYTGDDAAVLRIIASQFNI